MYQYSVGILSNWLLETEKPRGGGLCIQPRAQGKYDWNNELIETMECWLGWKFSIKNYWNFKGARGNNKVMWLKKIYNHILELDDTYVDTPTLINKLSKMN